jgi:hypothetical protein
MQYPFGARRGGAFLDTVILAVTHFGSIRSGNISTARLIMPGRR